MTNINPGSGWNLPPPCCEVAALSAPAFERHGVKMYIFQTLHILWGKLLRLYLMVEEKQDSFLDHYFNKFLTHYSE